ncbi:hypothetical protein M8J76_011256 [Diaphorina citri]|nr:hypothetical protein M8J76_011256 [Diaphorina citri]KAI5735370.1 hypothetical protein M8J77_017486 [Diaphorina citri]
MAKFSITTTKPTRRTTAEGHINTRIHGKQAKRSTSRRRAYTMDINSEDYSIKKHGNWSANPAQYAYEARMSASAELKSILVKDIRKQFFQITAHRKNLSQLEILKNQSRVLYDNYMKIINKSTTINYWRRLRDARYNNTEPLDIDYSATLAEAYKDMFEYGGTTETGFITVPYSLVQYYRTCMDDLYNRIPPGPVIYDSKDILGSSGLT